VRDYSHGLRVESETKCDRTKRTGTKCNIQNIQGRNIPYNWISNVVQYVSTEICILVFIYSYASTHV
jgi:hypothetical protein